VGGPNNITGIVNRLLPLSGRNILLVACLICLGAWALAFLLGTRTAIVWIPLLNVVLVAVFGLLIYLVAHNIRVTERSSLWVGLAKETAHQLGTPISSLMGWVEYMRAVRDPEAAIDPQQFIDQAQKICDDMDKDLQRLRKITNRFSQIGSVPALSLCDLNAIIEDCMQYFRLRLPLLGKRIEMTTCFGNLPKIPLNRDLIEWVFENLFKNSIDAIVKDDGFIEVRTEYLAKEKQVRIHHYDNGRGVAREDQSRLFTPGFTTKKRGWGLGLTLARRVVEDYHRGKIYLHWSQQNMGAVFCIEVPAPSPSSLPGKAAGKNDGPENIN
jgi:NtrC-family two-component system sensor histidine kinase KinB